MARGNQRMRIADRYLGVCVLFILGLFRRSRRQPVHVSTIALICIGAIGDLLLSAGSAIPAIRRRFPEAKLVLLVSETNRGLVPLLPTLDAVHTLPLTNPFQSIPLINKLQADIAIDFAQWPRISAVLLALSNVKFAVGFRTRHQYRHYTYDRVVTHDAKVHEFENFKNILAAVGVPSPSWPQVVPSPSAIHRIDDLGLGSLIVCHPWAAGIKHELREWPCDHWRTLAKALIDQGYNIAFTGGPSDVSPSRDIMTGISAPEGRLYDFAGILSLDETAALLARSDAVISVNSAIMHIASALNVAVIGLHGPTNPVRWGPLSKRSISLTPNTRNAGYLNLGFEYPRNAQPCMQFIKVESVLDAIKKLCSPQDTTLLGSFQSSQHSGGGAE